MRQTSPWPALRTAVFLVVSCAVALLSPLPAVAAPPAQSLHILLTNDDGFEAPGLQTLHKALLESGFRVSVVAPRDQQSGSSMRVSIGEVTVEQIAPDFWAIGGSPADSVSYALNEILAGDRPDIVVSGSNFGQNLGANTNISGTIGAAIMANQLGVPALAVSVGIDLNEREAAPVRFPRTMDAFPRAAAFVVKLLRDLDSSRAAPEALLPPDVLLNVNYPALPESSIKGVRIARVARTGGFKPRFVATDKPDVVRIDLEHAEASADSVADADTVLFAEGYVTISLLDARLDARRKGRDVLRERLRGLLTPALPPS